MPHGASWERGSFGASLMVERSTRLLCHKGVMGLHADKLGHAMIRGAVLGVAATW